MPFKYNPFSGEFDYYESASGGSVTSVTNSDGTITSSPTTGAVVLSVNRGKILDLVSYTFFGGL